MVLFLADGFAYLSNQDPDGKKLQHKRSFFLNNNTNKMKFVVFHLITMGVSAALPGPAASDGFALHLFSTDTGAVCLDGTPAGYYERPGLSDSWMIELEGGGWCISEEDCLSRSKTDIGSSSSWPPTGCPGMDGGSNGMFSNNCNVSSFCNWTAIHLNYCDGASFAGYKPVPIVVQGYARYYCGFAVHLARLLPSCSQN